MANLTSSLTVRLIDDVSKPARTVAQALTAAENEAKKVAKAMNFGSSTDRFRNNLQKLGMSAKDIEKVGAAWEGYARKSRLALSSSDWTKKQIAGVRQWEAQTLSALKTVQREEAAFAAAQAKALAAPRGSAHGEQTGRQIAAGIIGGYVAHSAAHFAHKSLETYREFDKERRFGKAVMGISDADQADLVKQAVHMGGTTKYNDIQVLEAQRELAARGLNKDQVLGMMGAAGDLGQSLDLSLPDAVKQMEGAIFGFKKNISTTADAMSSARQTADIQVRAAKMSGMTPEDLQMVYKYGATPSRLAGVSEQTLLAFGGISKKANMGGDEAGVAFRALMSASNAPTRGAKEALLANGLDYSKYQKPVQSIPLDAFVKNVAGQYGVKLNEKAQASLSKVFSDPKILNDAALFTPAVTTALGDSLGKKDAKSLKSIAGMAGRFRTAAGGGADANAFIKDLLTKMSDGKSGIALANAIFGSKQGGRIANALGDKEVFNHMIELLTDHSEGYAKKVSDERMSGFDGAMSRFEGAVKNLESSIGRSFDGDGNGGFLTGVTNAAGRAVQALAELPAPAQRLGVALGAAGAGFAGFKGVEALMGGFGLKGSAVALTSAAEALIGAAEKQALTSGGLPGKLAKGAGAVGAVGAGEGVVAGVEGAVAGGGALAGAATIGLGLGTLAGTIYGLKKYQEANPEAFRGGARAGSAYKLYDKQREPYGPFKPGHWETSPGSARHGGGGKRWVDDVDPRAATPMDFTPGPARGLEPPMNPRSPMGPFARPADTLEGGHWETTAGGRGGSRRWVQDVKAQAEEAKGALAEVSGVAVSPQVDVSSIRAATSAAQQLLQILSSIPGAMNGIGSLKMPDLGGAQRGSFGSGGGIANGSG